MMMSNNRQSPVLMLANTTSIARLLGILIRKAYHTIIFLPTNASISSSSFKRAWAKGLKRVDTCLLYLNSWQPELDTRLQPPEPIPRES